MQDIPNSRSMDTLQIEEENDMIQIECKWLGQKQKNQEKCKGITFEFKRFDWSLELKELEQSLLNA